MSHQGSLLTFSMCLAATLACSQGNDGTYSTPYAGTGGTLTVPEGTGGTGGASTSTSTDYYKTDSSIAWQIAMTANMVASFLWNRDIQPLGKSPFTVSDICLLTGNYSATGTRQFLTSSCSGTATADIDFTMNLCEHQLPGTEESVIFSGDLKVQWANIYNGDCSKSVSSTKTITATGMAVTYNWGYTDFKKTFSSCAIALNYTSQASDPSSYLSGRVCDIPVAITFSN